MPANEASCAGDDARRLIERRRSFDDLLDSIWVDEDDGQALSRIANHGRTGERSLSVNEDRTLRVATIALKGNLETSKGQIRAHRRDRRLQGDQFALGVLGRAELEADDGATTEGIAELFEGLGAGGVLAALDARNRRGRRAHARR